MEKGQDRRVRKTKEAIARAFSTLLQSKNYSDITVKELTEAADITRKTFYLHYGTMDDVLREFIDNKWHEIIGSLIEAGVVEDNMNFYFCLDQIDYVAMLKQLRTALKYNGTIFRKIAGDQNCRHVMNQLMSEYEKRMLAVYQQHYRLKPEILRLYITNSVRGIFALHMEWFASSGEISIEEFASIVQNVTRHSHDLLKEWEIPQDQTVPSEQ